MAYTINYTIELFYNEEKYFSTVLTPTISY